MKNIFGISLLSLFFMSLGACNIHKVVPRGQFLLRKNRLNYGETKVLKPSAVKYYILQQPNFYVLGYPPLVGVYSLADPHPDSTYFRFVRNHPGGIRLFEKVFSTKQVYKLRQYYVGLNREIQSIGEPPVLVDTVKMNKSARNLHLLFKNKGFLDNWVSWHVYPHKNLKADVHYRINEKARYRIDSITEQLSSPVVRQLYARIKPRLKTKPRQYYDRDKLSADRQHITGYFRNHGLFDFQLSHVRYNVVYDSMPRPRIHLFIDIPGKSVQQGDSLVIKDFVPYRYEHIRVHILRNLHDSLAPVRTDSIGKISFAYSSGRYFRPQILKRSLFIRPDSLFSDRKVNYTRKQLMNLQNFWQIYISHTPKKDSLLDADIVLVPYKRFGAAFSLDVSRSNIRPLGLSGEATFTWRNVFHGFENLSLSFYVLRASSIRFNLPRGKTDFNVTETGIDLNLRIPRIIAPGSIQRLIPTYMQPRTDLGLHYTTQTNIGLDREKIYLVYGYQWQPNRIVTNKVNPLEINHVNYRNPEKYFEIYTAAFDRLHQIARDYYHIDLSPAEAEDFIRNVLSDAGIPSGVRNTVRQIYERKQRLTENALIISTNYRMLYDTRTSLTDNHFWLFKFYADIAGWIPAALSRVVRFPRNDLGQKMINRVPYAEFAKFELTFIRHWNLHRHNILAWRLYGGVAVPFGNSKNIPFVEAFYAGGSSDIRAWRAFELGPGSTGGVGEFNEANFKLMTNLEWRFTISGPHRGALFADAGNIWNIWDDIPYEKAKFQGFSSLRDLGIGGGLGYRYDFGFFALRIDYAFKWHDPAFPEGQRWKWPKFTEGTLQLGINYPF